MTTCDALIYTRRFSFKFTNFHIYFHCLEKTDTKLCPMTNIDSAKTRGEYYARKFNKGNLAYRDINNTKLNQPFFPKIVDCYEVISLPIEMNL